MTDSLVELKQLIDFNKAVLVYFTASNCSVCHAIKPKIQTAFTNELPKIKQIFINSDTSKEITSNYGIFSFPTVLIFLESKEFFRVSRNFSIEQFLSDVKRPYELLFKDED